MIDRSRRSAVRCSDQTLNADAVKRLLGPETPEALLRQRNLAQSIDTGICSHVCFLTRQKQNNLVNRPYC